MSFAELMIVVWRYRWLVAVVWVLTMGTVYGVTVTLPKRYQATATIVTPKEGGALSSLATTSILQQIPGIPIPGIALPSLTPNRDLLIGLLQSRTIAQAVVERFRLQERYQARYPEDAIAALRGVTLATVSKEGIVSIRVEDNDPQLAAQMANYYVEQVDRMVAQYGTGEAGRQRVFLTAQLARARVGLGAAEDELRRFQEQNRAIALQDQTRGAIEASARLKGEIMAAEVQLQVVRNFATDANPDVVALRRRIDEMRRQLAGMQFGERLGTGWPSGVSERDSRDFTLPLPKVPEVGLELARLTREVKVQETLVGLLIQQLEQAKLSEAKDLPIVQALDRAVPPARHSKPRLRFNLVLGCVGGLCAGTLLAFAVEYLRDVPRQVREGLWRDRRPI